MEKTTSMMSRLRLWGLFVLAALVVISGCGKRYSGYEPKVNNLLAQARLDIQSRKYSEANSKLRDAIRLTRHKADVYGTAIDMDGTALYVGKSAVAQPGLEFSREMLNLYDSKKLDRDLTSEELRLLLLGYWQFATELQQGDEAIIVLERAVRLYPEDSMSANNLSYCYAERGVNLKRALQLVQKALSKQPKEPSFIDTLGWVYFKLGRYDDALREMKRAVSADPSQADTRYHLGMVYAALGEKVDAEIEFGKALAQDPGHAGAREELRKLKHTR